MPFCWTVSLWLDVCKERRHFSLHLHTSVQMTKVSKPSTLWHVGCVYVGVCVLASRTHLAALRAGRIVRLNVVLKRIGGVEVRRVTDGRMGEVGRWSRRKDCRS